jgi:hypothetical protein
MRRFHTAFGLWPCVLVIAFTSTGFSQTPEPDAPDFRVEVYAYVVDEFNHRMHDYFDLRGRLEQGLTPLAITADVATIEKAELDLASRIRGARAGAREGDLFTPDIASVLKLALHHAMTARTWRSIMDDNPGPFAFRINGTYHKTRSLATMPANILAVLPSLPDDVQYRFLGRHLVLHDVRANVIIDRMPYAIERRFHDSAIE